MKIAVFILFNLFIFSLLAQEQKFKNQEFSFSFGIENHVIEKFAPNENLDFINYLDDETENLEFILLKLGYKFDFLSKMSADIKLIMMDDIIPDNYDISVHYFLKPWLGMGLGSMLNKNWITYFEEYQIQYLPDYYLMDQNVKQFTNYDLGFYLSPALKPLDNSVFKLLIKCDLGFSSFLKKEATFYHKKKLSNERLQYYYDTGMDFQPYIQPKIDLSINAFKLKKATFGFLINSNYYYSKRSMNYSRTIQTWTSDNKVVEQIETSKHNFSRFEMNMGIFLRW